MKKSRFTEEQIVFALKQAELGTSVPEVCRKLGISDATFYIWRKKYGGISPSELKHMRQLEEENLRLKKLVADLSLDKAMLQDVLAKKNRRWRACANGAGTCRHVTGPARDRSVLHYKSAVALSATALWRQTTVHSACESGKSPKPGFIMATAEFTSCSGGGAGGIITNAFTGSIANRVCPCVSNARGGTNRRSGDNRSLRGCIRIMSGAWILSLTPYLTGVGYVC